MKIKGCIWIGAAVYLLAAAVMHVPSMVVLQREEVAISGPDGRPCLGTVWRPSAPPKAVLLAGHGVTANRGIMAMMAGVFARGNYTVVAFDFWGHGSSREPFDWQANTDQVKAWCTWARERYPDVPLAYLGYSMGGFAGTEAFLEAPSVDAFIALGALPRRVPECPTLVASGAFEQLFTFEQALQRMADRGDVVSSPFSDHSTEAHDPVLIRRMRDWLDDALGFEPASTFPWMHWWMTMGALVLGIIGALWTATQTVALFRRDTAPGTPSVSSRPWSINPYRIAGYLLRYRGTSAPPNNGSLLSALAGGIVFSAILTLLLSWLLNRHIFTSSMNHPERLLTWLILIPILAGPVWLDAWVLERLPLGRTRNRFAIAAFTRALPFVLVSLFLQWLGPGIAFAGMMFGIFAFVLVMLSLVHALATRASADWRAGAAASNLIFAWLIAFWFPLSWPWV